MAIFSRTAQIRFILYLFGKFLTGLFIAKGPDRIDGDTHDFRPSRTGTDGTAHIFSIGVDSYGDDGKIRFIEAKGCIGRVSTLFRTII